MSSTFGTPDWGDATFSDGTGPVAPGSGSGGGAGAGSGSGGSGGGTPYVPPVADLTPAGIIALKEAVGPKAYQPLVLAEFIFQDGTILRMSSENLDAASGGPQWMGFSWKPRLNNQQLEAISSTSNNGIVQSPTITLSIADGDKSIENAYELTSGRGFKGAKLRLYFVYWLAGTTTFSADYRVIFVGICNPSGWDCETLTVTADNLLNMTRKTLPQVRVQSTCNWIFPTNATQRAEAADNPDSIWWNCGYSPDVDSPNARGNLNGGSPYTSCGLTYSDCVARLGDQALPQSAPPGGVVQIEQDTSGRKTARFSGIYWNPPLSWKGKDYLSGNTERGINNNNDSKFNDYYPLVYGKVFVEPIVMNVEGDPNSTRFEVDLGVGLLRYGIDVAEPIDKVIVNDQVIKWVGEVGADPINAWYWVTTGDRSGETNKSPIFNGSGNCYGGTAVILIVVPKAVQAPTSVPTVRVLLRGPKVRVFTADDISAYTRQDTDNPVWFLLDMLLKGDWKLSDVNLQTFISEAVYCQIPVSYLALDGTTKTHARYRAGLAYREPRTIAECIQLFLASFRGMLRSSNLDGRLEVLIKKTLADQQPDPIPSSNNQGAISSVAANGSAASGYLAYEFNESNIKVIDNGTEKVPSLKFSQRKFADTPNRIQSAFQDEDADYVTDTLSVIDTDDVARLGQQTIKGNLTCEGLNNFDQSFRLLQSLEAENFRGNPRTPITGTFETGGTLIAELITTAKIVDLRVGDICGLNFAAQNVVDFLMRVQSIDPGANYEENRVTLTYHKDEWYTDQYGQANQKYQPPSSGYSLRAPFAWCPDQDQPQTDVDVFHDETDWQMGISQKYATGSDGTVHPSISITGKAPVNVFSTIVGKPLFTLVSATPGGGTIPTGTYYFAVCAVDAVGLRSQPSTGFPKCTLATAGSITASGFVWPEGTSGYEIYGGTDPNRLSLQTSGGGGPSAVVISAYNVATLGCPDPIFHHFDVDISRVWHPGCWVAQVTGVGGSSVTVANAGWTGGQWTGHVLSVVGKKLAGADVPVMNFLVTGNSSDTVTVTGSLTGIVVGDTVTLRTKASTFSTTTIGDSGLVNSLKLPGIPINVMAIIGSAPADVVTQLPHELTTGDQVLLTNCGSASLLPAPTPGLWTVTVVNETRFTLNGSTLNPLLVYLSGGIMQKLSTGMVPGEEIGRRAQIIFGTGAGQSARIIGNTTTVLTVDSEWITTPDATSVFIVTDDGPIATLNTAAVSNANPLTPIKMTASLPGNPNMVILVKPFTASSTDKRSLEYDTPWREIYVPLPNGLNVNFDNGIVPPPGSKPVQFKNDDTKPGTVSGLFTSILLETNEVLNASQDVLDFSDLTPAPPTNRTNVKWQSDPVATGKESAYMPGATTTAEGAIKLAQDLRGTSQLPIVAGLQTVPVITTTPLDKQVLTYISADGKWEPKDAYQGPGAGTGGTGFGRWYEQIPNGIRNGINRDFYTDYVPITPVSGTPPVVPFQLSKNGLLQSPYVPRYSLAAGSNHIVMASGSAPQASDEFICWYFIGDPGTVPPSAVSSAQVTIWTAEDGGSYSPLVDIQYWHPDGTTHDPIVTFDNSSWARRQNTATVTGITTTTDMAGGFVQFSLDGTVFGNSSPPATIKIYDCYLTLTLVGGGTTLVRPTSWSFDSGSDQPSSSWKKNTVYATGTKVLDSNGNIQQAAVGGLSGNDQPVWHTSGSTPDNTITWNFIGAQTSATGQISGSPTLGYDTDSVPPVTFFSLSRTFFSGFSTPGSVRLIF